MRVGELGAAANADRRDRWRKALGARKCQRSPIGGVKQVEVGVAFREGTMICLAVRAIPPGTQKNRWRSVLA